ncbi:hypothetical protein, partial [Acinetobacter baumannii]
IRSTTYPSYALNLAQLGALCISNLCATKPMNANHYIQLAREFRKSNSEPILASQKIEHLARYIKLHPKIGAYEDYIRKLPLGSRLPRGKYFKGRKAGDNIRVMDEYWSMFNQLRNESLIPNQNDALSN